MVYIIIAIIATLVIVAPISASIGWFNASKNVTEGVNDTKLLDGYKVVNEAKIGAHV